LRWKQKRMRMISFAAAGALMVCPVLSALAASDKAWTPSLTQCTTLFTKHADHEYRQFMIDCLSGKVEGLPVVPPRLAPADEIPVKWDRCEALAKEQLPGKGSQVEQDIRRGRALRLCLEGNAR
jgi:hypothetical protein